MKIKVFLLLLMVSCFTLCDQPGKGPTSQPVLVSRNFIDDNTFRIVCRGYPTQGLTGVPRVESAKYSALQNAYYFIKLDFIDAVAPDRGVLEEKYEVPGDYAIIYYTIKKRGLKKMLRPESKPDPRPEPKPDQNTVPGAEKNTKPDIDSNTAPQPGPDGGSQG